MLRNSLRLPRLVSSSLGTHSKTSLRSHRFTSTDSHTVVQAVSNAVEASPISDTLTTAIETTPVLGWKLTHIAMYAIDQVQ